MFHSFHFAEKKVGFLFIAWAVRILIKKPVLEVVKNWNRFIFCKNSVDELVNWSFV